MVAVNASLLTQRRRQGVVPAWLVSGCMMAVVTLGVALVALKPAKRALKGDGRPVSLLGFDPYTPVSSPGKRDDIAGEWGEEGDEHRLPHWATDWPADAETPCASGEQCVDHVGNPLGMLGKWVMQATTMDDSPKREWNIRHNCVGLPGWAVEECMRMREEEKKLGKDGHTLEPAEPAAPAAAEQPPAAKKARTTVLAEAGARGGARAQRLVDAMDRRKVVPMQRSGMMARAGGFGGPEAAEQAGEVVLVPARDVRVV
mmetsp:Transcript_10475/g.20623  ORF Transcript_10475/g.20623 Transcript_10475/m.20623 type:complete len:258 (-) Transcript_10475:37-810(-)